MQDTLKDYDSNISIGGRPISNLRFKDDLDIIAGSSNELQKLTDSLEKNASRYVMELNDEKNKILVNDTDQ